MTSNALGILESNLQGLLGSELGQKSRPEIDESVFYACSMLFHEENSDEICVKHRHRETS